MKVKLMKCGICENWFRPVLYSWTLDVNRKHCNVCGAYHYQKDGKWYHYNVHWVPMARALPIQLDGVIERAIKRM